MRRGLVTALAVLALAACDGSPAGLPSPTPQGSIPNADPNCPTDGVDYQPGDAYPASTAELTIVAPEQGEIIDGTTVTVEVSLKEACILGQAQQLVRPDTGHVHITLDGRTITLAAGKTYTIDDVEPRLHTLQAEFAAADHVPFNPRVITTVNFRTT
ncbi:MAG TPA: hypothetical protein VGB83_09365 [Actinomycetota bacterium]